MHVEPGNIHSSPQVSGSHLKTAQANELSAHPLKEDTVLPSSSRSKGRGTKARMINVGGNRLESPSHSSRHKTDAFRSSGSRRANVTSTEWLSNSFDDNQMSPRSVTKIVDKELASQYNDIGDLFLENDSSNGTFQSLNNTSPSETIPGTSASSEPQTNHTPETVTVAESGPKTAIASPPGSPIAS